MLTGSDAKLTLTANVPSDFSGTITKWTLKNVKFSRGGVDFRAKSSVDVTSGTAVTIDRVSGKPYMSKTEGAFTWTADICYTVNNGTKTVERKLKTVTGTITAPAPDASKFVLDATPAGYTSYSCYKGTDGQTASASTANSKDNSTIYGIGGSYKSGLSSDVYNQCSGLLSYTATLDGNSASGDKADQTWAAHTIVCTSVTFDGVTKNCSASKTVYLTGLPYKAEPPKNSGSHPWVVEQGRIDWNDDCVLFRPITDDCMIHLDFYVPDDHSINVNIKCHVLAITGGNSHDMIVRLSGTNGHSWTHNMGSKKGDDHTFDIKDEYSVMKSNLKRFVLSYDYAITGPNVYIYNFIVNYR